MAWRTCRGCTQLLDMMDVGGYGFLVSGIYDELAYFVMTKKKSVHLARSLSFSLSYLLGVPVSRTRRNGSLRSSMLYIVLFSKSTHTGYFF